MACISLGAHFEEFVQDRIAQGHYQNASEVVRAGLRVLENYQMTLEENVHLLRVKIDQAFDERGPGWPADEDYEMTFQERVPLLKVRIDEAFDERGSSRPADEVFGRIEAMHARSYSGSRRMMRKVILRPAAETDLAEIYRYIAERSGNPETAIGYVRRIREGCEYLLAVPDAGPARDDLRPGIRIVTFDRHVVIAYTVPPFVNIEVGCVFYKGCNY
jgi:toxin ParE1/3/4